MRPMSHHLARSNNRREPTAARLSHRGAAVGFRGGSPGPQGAAVRESGAELPHRDHPWLPSSPCGPGCVQQENRVGTIRVIVRALSVAGLCVGYPFVHACTRLGQRQRVQRRFARALLRGMGVTLRVVDQRADTSPRALADMRTDAAPGGTEVPTRALGAEVGQGMLVVAGHIGWLDIIALAAVRPLCFVARADLVDWPVLGALARAMRVIPLQRERLRELPYVVDQVAARLAGGASVGVFPEGTTWCGRAHGRLRPAFFQAAVDSATPVQPVRLRYLDRYGNRATTPGFVGTDRFVDSILRILRSRGVAAEVVLAPIEHPGDDRRDLARRCERSIRAARPLPAMRTRSSPRRQGSLQCSDSNFAAQQ